jgi:hypothetical protein
MHGIQHLFRQHAIEKQPSTDSWHSTYSNGRTLSASNSNSDLKSSPWNQGIVFLFSASNNPCAEVYLNDNF